MKTAAEANRQAVLLFATQMVVAVANLPVTISLARALGPDGLGTYQLYNRIALVIIALACLGYPHAIAWASGTAKTDAELSGVLRVLYRSTTLSALFVAIMYVGLSFIPHELTGTTVWYVFGAFAALNIFAANLSNFFRGFLDIKGMAFSRIGQAASWLLMSATLALTSHLTVTTAAAALLASQLFGIVFSFWRLFQSKILRTAPKRADRSGISKFSRRVFPGLLIREWGAHLDQLVIGFFLSTYALGIYTVAASLTLALALLTGPIVNTAQPIIQATPERDLVDVAKKFYAVTFLVIGIPCVVLAALASILVPLIYGASFSNSADLVRILCIASFASALAACSQGVLVGIGRPGSGSVGTGIGFAVTCGLWSLLIPSFGLVGVAWSSALGMTVSVGVSFLFVSRRLGAKPATLVWSIVKQIQTTAALLLVSPRRALQALGFGRSINDEKL